MRSRNASHDDATRQRAQSECSFVHGQVERELDSMKKLVAPLVRPFIGGARVGIVPTVVGCLHARLELSQILRQETFHEPVGAVPRVNRWLLTRKYL
jgi:hypothetical protein